MQFSSPGMSSRASTFFPGRLHSGPLHGWDCTTTLWFAVFVGVFFGGNASFSVKQGNFRGSWLPGIVMLHPFTDTSELSKIRCKHTVIYLLRVCARVCVRQRYFNTSEAKFCTLKVHLIYWCFIITRYLWLPFCFRIICSFKVYKEFLI